MFINFLPKTINIMEKLLFQYAVVPAFFLLCITFSCQQQGKNLKAEEEMKALAERSLEIWNEGNLDLIDELIAPNCIRHEVDISEDLVGTEAYKEYVTSMRTTYPDFNVMMDELIIKDDKIIMRWTLTGTNTGPRGELPPTGNKIKVSGINVNKIVEGKTVEEWVYYNYAAGLTQLGFTITPPVQEGEQPEEQAE